jgi:uncharacterized protein (TIGR03083 family)
MSNDHYKSALLKGIQREWEALFQAVEKLTPAQMGAPDAGGWSPKDNLAHLAEWLKALAGYHMDHKSAEEVLGIPKELAEHFDFNRVNAFLVERSRERSVEDVLAELREKYAEVMARLESMPFEELLQPRFPDDPQKRPLLDWVMGNTVDHIKEHRLTIEKAL